MSSSSAKPAKSLEDYTPRDWIDSYRRGGELPPGVDPDRHMVHPNWRLDERQENGEREQWVRPFDGVGRLWFVNEHSSSGDVVEEAERDQPLPRRVLEPGEPTIDLWSFQPPSFLDTLQEDGIVHGRALDELQDEGFIAPYLWMLGQMEKRLPDHRGYAPIWAYTHKDDLRSARWRWYTGGVWMLRLHLRVPVSAVLVSEYDGWYSVLNNFPHLTRAEDEAWDAAAEKIVAAGTAKSLWAARKILDDERRDEVWGTWDRIFDAEFYKTDPGWFGSDVDFQACIDGLQMEWVVDVDLYKTGTTNEDRKRATETAS